MRTRWFNIEGVEELKRIEVIVNGDLISLIASASAGAEGPIPPKTAEQKLARKNKIKAKNTLMLAIPDEHLLKFHACKDAKSLSRIGLEATRNQRRCRRPFSRRIMKTLLHQVKKDRIKPMIAWNNIALIMRNKSDLDTLSMDDLYNNLKVYESEIKGKLMFLLLSPKDQASTASYADDVMFSFFSNQSNAPQLAYEDLEQIDAGDLKEMDLKWNVAMLIIRLKRFIKKIRRKIDFNDKETVGFDKTKVECYNCHRRGHFARECKTPRNHKNRNRDALRRNAPVDTSTTHVLVVQDEIDGYNWIFQAEEGITNFALMAYTSQALQKQYGQQCEALNKSNLEIILSNGLETLEARIVVT
ncbi:ribonuclease H-like domain-containing protein [Tanacetum coccineum]